jgi:hypothetical protein
MDSIQINTGEKRVAINGDPNRVIVFNPTDVVFVEKFYRLIGDFQTRLVEYQAKSIELDKDQTADENGIPANANTRLALLREGVGFIREQIDGLFGPGTSQIAFGDTLSLDACKQFFEGITPFIQTARVQKIQKYSNSRPKRNKK